jgi:hypothetical protein
MAEEDYPIKMYYYLTLKFKQMKSATAVAAQKPHRQRLPAVAPDLPVTSCQTLAWLLTKPVLLSPLVFLERTKLQCLIFFLE